MKSGKTLLLAAMTSLSLYAGANFAAASVVTLVSDSADASPYLNTPVGFPPSGISTPTDGGDGVQQQGGDTLSAGNGGGTRQGNAVFVFQLPDLGAQATPFNSASFSVTVQSVANGNGANYNPFGNTYDVYGLGKRVSSTVLSTDFYLGGNDTTDATKIQDRISNFDNNPDPGTSYQTSTAGNLVLTDYLNLQYDNGNGAGQYVFLRINGNFVNNSFGGISFYSGEVGNAGYQPTLTVDENPVPEPSTPAALGVLSSTMLLWRRKRQITS